ncbi:MAG: anhydro-N-acetylmuramic acid kinase [Synechococcus sp.]
MRVLGLMSGTSADGVDAVLARFQGPPQHPRWHVLRSASLAYPPALHQRIVAVGQGEPHAAAALLELAEAITEHHAAAARACDPEGLASVVGCHGQTLWHRPPHTQANTTVKRGASWQMLQAPLLAQLLQRPVVHDFRAADLALGGQGAPLVPMADAALLGATAGWCALLNLGGLANLTLIPPSTGPDRQAPVLGWDCGPANTLIDLAVEHFSEGQELFDRNGRRAAAGRIQDTMLLRWLQEPYLQQPPPKSTGREHFGRQDLQRRLAELQHHHPDLGPDDCIATLTALTAAVVAQDLNQLVDRGLPRPLELVVAGGGSHNPVLMQELQHRCRGLRVRRSDERGLPVDYREALVFALLAWWHQRRHCGNAPAVTGADKACVLGVLAEPPGS